MTWESFDSHFGNLTWPTQNFWLHPYYGAAVESLTAVRRSGNDDFHQSNSVGRQFQWKRLSKVVMLEMRSKVVISRWWWRPRYFSLHFSSRILAILWACNQGRVGIARDSGLGFLNGEDFHFSKIIAHYEFSTTLEKPKLQINSIQQKPIKNKSIEKLWCFYLVYFVSFPHVPFFRALDF